LSRAAERRGIYQSLTSFARPDARVFKIPAAGLIRQWLLLRYYSLLFDLKNCGCRSTQPLSAGLVFACYLRVGRSKVVIHDPALGFGERYFTALAARERWRGRMFIAAATAILSES
jgi:hypothetical protein